MDGVILRRAILDNNALSNGIYPLFGFALSDYCAKYGFTDEDVKHHDIFGAILTQSDMNKEIFEILYVIKRRKPILFIFDTNHVSLLANSGFVLELKDFFQSDEMYFEFENVYEDRMVFALNPGFVRKKSKDGCHGDREFKYIEKTQERLEAFLTDLSKHIPTKVFPDSSPTDDQTIKADAGKPKLTLVPRQIIFDIAKVREFGVAKYGASESWKDVDIQRYKDATFRHFLAYLGDPDGVDAESGISHLSHLACNIAFLCEMEHTKTEKENKDEN